MKGEIKNFAEHLFENCGGAVLSWIIEECRIVKLKRKCSSVLNYTDMYGFVETVNSIVCNLNQNFQGARGRRQQPDPVSVPWFAVLTEKFPRFCNPFLVVQSTFLDNRRSTQAPAACLGPFLSGTK